MPVLQRRMLVLGKMRFLKDCIKKETYQKVNTFIKCGNTQTSQFFTSTQLLEPIVPAFQDNSKTEDIVKSLSKPNAIQPFLEVTGGMKRQLKENGFVVCPGPVMKKLLLCCGASAEDLERLESGSVHNMVPSDPIPTMPHRLIAFHSMLIEPKEDGQTQHMDHIEGSFTNRVIEAMQFQCIPANYRAVTEIPEKEIASGKKDGAKLGFKRSGLRVWSLPPVTYAESSAPLAMAALNAYIVPDQHHQQDHMKTESPITINDQILIRVYRNKFTDESYSPTPEGIHQDGTEIGSATLIGMKGVRSGGESRIWKLEAPTGNYDEDKVNSVDSNLLLNHRLCNPWDTVYFNDRMVKHEVRAFDGERPCYRDVIVNFVRKPLKSGNDKKVITTREGVCRLRRC